MKISILSFLTIVLFSCEYFPRQESVPQYSVELIDHSSPDKLLKSYWAYRIWEDTTWVFDKTSLTFNFFEKKYFNYREKSYFDKLKDLKSNHYINRSIIDEVKSESDTRAIIMTQEYNYDGQKEYSKFKYIFIKNDDNWLIEDRFESCSMCSGVGKRKNLDEKSDRWRYGKCTFCSGTGWRSRIYFN